MTLLFFVNKLFSFGVVLGHIFITLVVVYVLFLREKYPGLAKFLTKHGLLLAFLVSLISVLGSLFYSQIAGFAPCELCWFQRIFMYPLVVLLGMALVKKERVIIDYALGLLVIGSVISLYHNYVYYMNKGLSAYCQVGGSATSCVVRYVFELGYVTIPMMALTAFALIIIFLVFTNTKNAG